MRLAIDRDLRTLNGSSGDYLPVTWLSQERIGSRAEAEVVINSSRRHGRAISPHSSLDPLTSLLFKQQHQLALNRAAFFA